MNKRIFMIIFVACLLVLSGCRLAKPQAESSKQPDKLVGVFITIDQPIDETVFLSGAVEGDVDDFRNNGQRIYATDYEEVYIDSDGVEQKRKTYKFNGIEGIMLSSFMLPDDEGSREYYSTEVDNEICDVHFNFEENSLEVSGTIYLNSNLDETSVYMNPIYQTASGSMYLTPGTGEFFTSDQVGTLSISIDENYTIDDNDSVSEFSSRVKLTVGYTKQTEEVSFIEMDSDNKEIKKSTFSCEIMPDEFEISENTEYLIVEEKTADGVRRSIYEKDESYLSVLCMQKEKLCYMGGTALNWFGIENE